jgi:glycolate oxidase FAD binding subunit
MVTLEPPDVATLASMLRSANADHLAVLPRGGGTKLTWGTPPARLDAVLSTIRLNAPIDHAAGDLVATVPAGASLASVNASLAREGQWLPLDPPFSDRATIGGIVATNDSGPRRHRYGTPRDLIIGIEMALVDGRIAKAGGRVVKNVAGYDLSRLLCGSFGSLAVVTSATFKLSPAPPASRTIVATLKDSHKLGALTQALNEAPLTPSTIELDSPPLRLLVRFESTESAADRQASAAAVICEQYGATTTKLSRAVERDAWTAYENELWDSRDTIVKIAVLPTDVATMIDHVQRVGAQQAITCHIGGRAALGIIVVRLSGASEKHPAAIIDLRQEATARRGSAVVLASESSVKARVDPWGDVGDHLSLMRAVKARFDPSGTLSPGHGPGGL